MKELIRAIAVLSILGLFVFTIGTADVQAGAHHNGGEDSGLGQLPGTISSGMNHTCALRRDGTIACWGNDYYGQASPPEGTFRQVSAGDYHTCGVRSDGTIPCWGRNHYGQAVNYSGAYRQISAGGLHTCALQGDGILKCWGAGMSPVSGEYPHYTQAFPPTNMNFRQVSAGGLHTCGLRSSGALYCWGSRSYDQDLYPSGSFIQISAFSNSTCGLRSDGALTCWGWNYYGQIQFFSVFLPLVIR